jgi:hypothetical protein
MRDGNRYGDVAVRSTAHWESALLPSVAYRVPESLTMVSAVCARGPSRTRDPAMRHSLEVGA